MPFHIPCYHQVVFLDTTHVDGVCWQGTGHVRSIQPADTPLWPSQRRSPLLDLLSGVKTIIGIKVGYKNAKSCFFTYFKTCFKALIA